MTNEQLDGLTAWAQALCVQGVCPLATILWYSICRIERLAVLNVCFIIDLKHYRCLYMSTEAALTCCNFSVSGQTQLIKSTEAW